MITRPTGTVIVLNGTSSAGKSSIARELLPILDEQFYLMARDDFNSMRHQRPLSDEALETVLDRMVRGFHRAVAGMAATGNNLVVDHIMRESSWVTDFVSVVTGDVVLVGVHCPLPELRRREYERGDRPIGLVDAQFDKAHRDLVYDLEVDTSVSSPVDCALRIRSFLTARPRTRALDRLRGNMSH